MPPPAERAPATRVPTIIVHGGAGADPSEGRDELRQGVRAATVAGWRVLSAGGAGLAAGESAVRALHGPPRLHARRGPAPTPGGAVGMDAPHLGGHPHPRRPPSA